MLNIIFHDEYYDIPRSFSAIRLIFFSFNIISSMAKEISVHKSIFASLIFFKDKFLEVASPGQWV